MANHGMWEYCAPGRSMAWYRNPTGGLVEFTLSYSATRHSYLLMGDSPVNVVGIFPAAEYPPHTLLPAVESLLQSLGYTPA